MQSDTPRLLRYTKLGQRDILDGVLWVAITQGTPGSGGDGIVLAGHTEALTSSSGDEIDPPLCPGAPFKFAANKDYHDAGTVRGGAYREVWGLDAAPEHVAVAWMKYQHKGLI